LAANGLQYRALFSNSAGSAATLPATLSVSARIVAPAITTQPIAQAVQASQLGLFSISASGTSPLNYQWFKNGQALVAANATEVLIPANAADVGTSYQISVQVSNSAGTVTSAVVTMAVTAVPANTGTLINATKGGVITSGTGVEGEPGLFIPAGSLASDTTISLVATSGTVIGLPAGAIALGDVLEVGPSGISFVTPVTLNLPVPSNIPEGKVLAVIELPGATAGFARAGINFEQSAFQDTNLRRVAKSKLPSGGVMAIAADVLVSVPVLCVNSQDIRAGRINVDLSRAARYITAAVPPEACTSSTTTSVKRALIPSTTTAPCTDADWAKVANGGVELVSRHVQCGVYISSDFDITGADDTDYGKFRWEVRVGSHDPANGLNKTFSFSTRLSRTAPAFADSPKQSSALPTLSFQPVISCSSSQDNSGQCLFAPTTLSVTAQGSVPTSLNQGWSSANNTALNVSWNGGDGTWNDFSFNQLELHFAKPGGTISLSDRNYAGFLLGFSSLRCDKKLSSGTITDGCVYPAAPAVLVLSATDPAVKEAAEHIREAQQGPLKALGGLDVDPVTSVATASTGNALQRTRIDAANKSNRAASCEGSQSLFVTRPGPVSASCQANPAGCQCDEYPFAATWNGGFFAPNNTSVKRIQGPQNQRAGANLSGFYQKERVLDLTVYDGSPTATPYDLNQERSRAGENFWVHIE
jgi:VCBS repeat-containing protein